MAQDPMRRRVLQGLAWASASAPYLISVTGRAASAAPAVEAGDFIGVIGDGLPGGRIAISFNGQSALVYFCDGTDDHKPTVARWIRGDSAAGSLRVTANGVTIVAQLAGDKAWGTLTLPDGHSHRFLASSRSYGQSEFGLYRSEANFNGTDYVGGWIVNPNRRATTMLERPTVHPVSWQSSSTTDRAGPMRVGLTQVGDLDDLERELEDYPRTGGGIIIKPTGAILPYAPPNLTTMTADVPGLGTFHLRHCVKTECT
jgi:hypothetical protein